MDSFTGDDRLPFSLKVYAYQRVTVILLTP